MRRGCFGDFFVKQIITSFTTLLLSVTPVLKQGEKQIESNPAKARMDNLNAQG